MIKERAWHAASKKEISATAYEPPLKVVVHQCRQCQLPFQYHYDLYYDPSHLTPIDFICRGCLPSYVQVQEQPLPSAPGLKPSWV